jgi:hypothetical protein
MRTVGFELLKELADILYTSMRIVVNCLTLVVDGLKLDLYQGDFHDG